MTSQSRAFTVRLIVFGLVSVVCFFYGFFGVFGDVLLVAMRMFVLIRSGSRFYTFVS